MDLFDHPYYRASKNVSRLIGRWPYQKYWESKICSLITIFLSTSQFIAKVNKYKLTNCDPYSKYTFFFFTDTVCYCEFG